jgi:hypothetical protein
MLKDKSFHAVDESDMKRRLPTPPPPKITQASADSGKALLEIMHNKSMKTDRALNAAKRIRDVNYTCRHFFEDCIAAFPELTLYVVQCEGSDVMTSSGRTADDEYQRTMGALFAVYWLMRLDVDGRQSFCFGIDNDWNPLMRDSPVPERRQDEIEKRQNFLDQLQWQKLEDLFVDAGLLSRSGTNGAVTHDVDRTLAMLVLTAIHDIMKLQCLLPFIEEEYAPDGWSGYKKGDRIGDHDAALGYVLEYWPNALPSYAELPSKQKNSVKFTQCKMEYNMGWLVQAEAPPGALFQKFKSIISSGNFNEADVAFYFVHWLTDLAGAEPFPSEGCEKFVLKFPLKVLTSFMMSFGIVRQLSIHSETEVLEKYLIWRWQQSEQAIHGDPPTGVGSIARLRMTVMCQGDTTALLKAYQQLQQRDRDVLDYELALTGCHNQCYSSEDYHQREDYHQSPDKGPALLVYYAPALLQKAGATDPSGALIVLAEVFRQARCLYPLEHDQVSETVTVRIDALKELPIATIHQRSMNGEVWILQKTSKCDAQVHRVNLMQQPKEGFSWEMFRVLFAPAPPSASRRVIKTLGDTSPTRSIGDNSPSRGVGDTSPNRGVGDTLPHRIAEA